MSLLKLWTRSPGKGHILCTVLPVIFRDSPIPFPLFKAPSYSLVISLTGVMGKKKRCCVREEAKRTNSKRRLSGAPLLAVRLI